jgi:hypothetical protein
MPEPQVRKILDEIDSANEQDRQRRRALEEQEQRVPDLVDEDLRKEIPILLAEIHQESLKNKGIAVSPNVRTLARFASLLAVLSIQADIQTRRIVRLTWALVWVSVALLIFTLYLCYDAYLNEQRIKHERNVQVQQRESE